jgi:hypothetical protein
MEHCFLAQEGAGVGVGRRRRDVWCLFGCLGTDGHALGAAKWARGSRAGCTQTKEPLHSLAAIASGTARGMQAAPHTARATIGEGRPRQLDAGARMRQRVSRRNVALEHWHQ